MALAREAEPCVFMTFDDDIRYPVGYADTLVEALVRYQGKAVVGIHGILFTPPYRSYTRDMKQYHFQSMLESDARVDVVGGGTLAMVSNAFPVDPVAWAGHTDMDDLMLAIEAEKHHVSRYAIARPPRFLRAIEQDQSDSLWMRTQADDARQTARMLELIAMEERSPLGFPPRP